MKFTHYIAKEWNYGGKYEYSDKVYDKKSARFNNSANLETHREDTRNSIELWVKKFIGKYSIKLKEKSYINNGNDSYQDYYDYDSHHGYITLSGSFLKDNRLSLSYTADFEKKNYFDRVAVNTAREDRATQHGLSAYYTINKKWTFSYNFTQKQASSNAASGEFIDITNKIGLTADF